MVQQYEKNGTIWLITGSLRTRMFSNFERKPVSNSLLYLLTIQLIMDKHK